MVIRPIIIRSCQLALTLPLYLKKHRKLFNYRTNLNSHGSTQTYSEDRRKIPSQKAVNIPYSSPVRNECQFSLTWKEVGSLVVYDRAQGSESSTQTNESDFHPPPPTP